LGTLGKKLGYPGAKGRKDIRLQEKKVVKKGQPMRMGESSERIRELDPKCFGSPTGAQKISRTKRPSPGWS